MRKFLLTLVMAVAAMGCWAVEKTDEIPGNAALTAKYSTVVLECESGSSWLMVLKNEGDGPQMKLGSGGIVTKTSIGRIKKVEVTWGEKSNENIVVYGSHEPIADPKAISGEELGTIEFAANGTSSLDITGDWEYIGMTTTANLGKACQFVTMKITWDADEVDDTDAQDGLVVNEVCGNDGTAIDGSEDWIEIANPTAKALSLAGAQLVLIDDDGVETTLCTFANGKTLDAGAYLVCKRTVDFEAGISNSKNIIVKLVSANGKALSKFDKRAALTDNGHHKAGGSYSRIPDLTGEWAAVQNATPGTANDATPIAANNQKFTKITAATALVDGLEFILVNEAHDAAMSSAWSTTKDGAVYQLAEPVSSLDCEANQFAADINRVAVCKLEALADGQWAIQFGETNNYKNEGRYLACETFKNLGFKKTSDKKGVACEISFDESGNAVISYGTLAGCINFNYKGDATDRFLNYDPNDNAAGDHLPIALYGNSEQVNAIKRVENSSVSGNAVYNLSGQCVNGDFRGVVIVNGKKTLQK